MACSRRSLTAGYNYIYRRLHSSLSHLAQDDRENYGVQRQLPLSMASTSQKALSSSVDRFRSPVKYWRCREFSISIAFDQSLRNYSSSSENSNDIGYSKDVVDVLTENTVNSSAAIASAVPLPFPGEVAAAAADSFPPVAALQHVIDAVHSFTGLNWWASIALTTFLIRGATVPLLLNQLKASAKLNIMRPEMEKLKEELDKNRDPEFLQEGQKRMKALFVKHGVTPFTPLKGALIQGPIFISFFFAISNMVEKVPSFKGGGMYWFTDLTTPDVMYIFPVLTSLTFLATIELNMQEGMEGNNMAKTMKNFSRLLGVLTIPFTASFPKAIFCYWVTSNIFSLIYGFALKHPQVRKLLNLPGPLPKLELASRTNFAFFGSPKLALPTASSTQEDVLTAVQAKYADKARRVPPSSAIVSQRIKKLEKSVKARNRSHKR